MVLEKHWEFLNQDTSYVLILVWVEYGLGDLLPVYKAGFIDVLILVWVEYGLGDLLQSGQKNKCKSS